MQTSKVRSPSGSHNTLPCSYKRASLAFFKNVPSQKSRPTADGRDLVSSEIWGDFRGAQLPASLRSPPRPRSPAPPQRAFRSATRLAGAQAEAAPRRSAASSGRSPERARGQPRSRGQGIFTPSTGRACAPAWQLRHRRQPRPLNVRNLTLPERGARGRGRSGAQ